MRLIGFRSHEDLWDLDAHRFRLPDDASRFEYATLAYGAVAGMGVAIEALADIGIDRIHEWDMGLARTLEAGLGEFDLAPLRPAGAPLAAPIVSVRVPAEVPVAMAEAGVIGSERGGVVRFSPHLFNTADDIAEALAVVGRALRVAPTR